MDGLGFQDHAGNGDKTTFTDPNIGQTLEYSGDPHEYLNGEHVQEWESSQRTVQLPEGTKVTLSIDRLYKVFRILARL